MAVTVDSLKVPRGPISPTLVPNTHSNVLDANLEIYIDRASADSRVTSDPNQGNFDAMVRALTLHLFFQDAYIEMNAKPLQVTVSEKGGHGYSMEQIRNVRVMSEKYLTEFLALLTPKSGSAVRGGTKAVANRYSF